MKRINTAIILLFYSVFFASSAIAQNKPLACQTDAAAGLEWENGRWKITRYVEDKFVLVQTKDSLTKDSVAKALQASELLTICHYFKPQIGCHDASGGNLYFDPDTLKGGISYLIGGTSVESRRDSVVVRVFSCTPF